MSAAGALALNAAVLAFAALVLGFAADEASWRTERYWVIAATVSLILAIVLAIAAAWAAVIWS